ncbi:hypothetical protein JCM10213_007939 [Rhodosporidiobolus nylandii]
MSSEVTQPCCVCGTPTTQRCGRCLAAGPSLFFCGTECQKLIWAVHKRACGLRSFEYPLLSSAEAEYAKQILSEHVLKVEERTERESLKGLLREFRLCKAGEEEAYIDLLSDSASSQSDELDRRDLRYPLVIVRFFMTLNRTSDPSAPDQVEHPFDHIARVHFKLYGLLGPNLREDPSPAWLSPLQHALLPFVALYCGVHKKQPKPKTTDEAFARIGQWIKTVDPIEAVVQEKVLPESGLVVATKVYEALAWAFGEKLFPALKRKRQEEWLTNMGVRE